MSLRKRYLLLFLFLVSVVLASLGMYYWPETYLRAARTALAQRDNEGARKALTNYLKARPDSVEGHLLLAQIERRANNYGEALKHLDACPRSSDSRDAIDLERGLIAIQQGFYTAELNALCAKHLARQDGNEYMILEAMSQGFLKNYRLKEALMCLQRMLVLQPDSNFALRRRAWICVKSGQFDQAEKDYRQALEIEPNDLVARQELAQILLDIRKNAKEAAEHFERIVAEQRDSQSVMGLAKSWRILGCNEDARTMLEAWLKDNPRDALALME
ncbi:MAG TPA: tetratricopeptide repeat protein, partial [Gemmataceae bacterium]|nr:tetratricopeptide repeat protein [Gemmataceae bacterium]